MLKVKVKWSRYRPGVAQRVGRGIALLFHDHGTRRGWVVSSTPRPHFTPWKDPVPIVQEAGWASEPGRAENLVPTGIRCRTVQPVVSHYTDWATRPTYRYVGQLKAVWRCTLQCLHDLTCSRTHPPKVTFSYQTMAYMKQVKVIFPYQDRLHSCSKWYKEQWWELTATVQRYLAIVHHRTTEQPHSDFTRKFFNWCTSGPPYGNISQMMPTTEIA